MSVRYDPGMSEWFWEEPGPGSPDQFPVDSEVVFWFNSQVQTGWCTGSTLRFRFRNIFIQSSHMMYINNIHTYNQS